MIANHTDAGILPMAQILDGTVLPLGIGIVEDSHAIQHRDAMGETLLETYPEHEQRLVSELWEGWGDETRH